MTSRRSVSYGQNRKVSAAQPLDSCCACRSEGLCQMRCCRWLSTAQRPRTTRIHIRISRQTSALMRRVSLAETRSSFLGERNKRHAEVCTAKQISRYPAFLHGDGPQTADTQQLPSCLVHCHYYSTVMGRQPAVLCHDASSSIAECRAMRADALFIKPCC